MKQTVLIRSKILKLIQNLRIYISCLPETEMEALKKLQDPEVHLRIADYALNQLGADVPVPGVSPEYFNKTKRAIAKVPGMKPKKRRYRKLADTWNKKKDVPRETSVEVGALSEETRASIAIAQPSEAAQTFNHETQEAMLEARAMGHG
jgi:hypothetical protein